MSKDKQIEAMKQSIIEEASIQMTGHPSKDARWFAKSVYEYFMAEQPVQQEPMAWIERDMNCDDFDPDSVTCQKPDISSAGWEWVPLYTTPQAQPRGEATLAREPLTDEEIFTLFNKTLNGKPLDVNSITNFARAIEAAHGITGSKT